MAKNPSGQMIDVGEKSVEIKNSAIQVLGMMSPMATLLDDTIIRNGLISKMLHWRNTAKSVPLRTDIAH